MQVRPTRHAPSAADTATPRSLEAHRAAGTAPVYGQLAAVFRRRIETGTWPVGSKIPSLNALVAEAGVARSTIRQALTILEHEGFIVRQRGRGTFVLRQPEARHWNSLHADWDSLVEAHEGVTTDLLRSECVAALPGLPHGGTQSAGYRFLLRRHRREGVPYLIGFAYIDQAIWDDLSLDAITDQPLIRVLSDLPWVTIGGARQTMEVSTADIEIADLLDIPLNAPVVIIDRTVFGEDETILLQTRGFYRADFVKLTITLR